MTEYPHVQAAHINALAEEGTRQELIDWLQKQWNEICYLRASLSPWREIERLKDTNLKQSLQVAAKLDELQIKTLLAENERLSKELGECQAGWETGNKAVEDNERLREALARAERKLSAYVGVCKGDKELTDTVLPMARAALNRSEG